METNYLKTIYFKRLALTLTALLILFTGGG